MKFEIQPFSEQAWILVWKMKGRTEMRHVLLTCKNHPNLRWSTKEVAWTVRPDGTGFYNQQRNIFFKGEPTGEGLYEDKSGLKCSEIKRNPDGTFHQVMECMCSAENLILAPEDEELKKWHEEKVAREIARMNAGKKE